MVVNPAPYLVVQRMSFAEGAAFVAALSRYLNSPDGASAHGSGDSPEVRAEVGPDSVVVLLSDRAYRAAVERFDPIPLAGSARAERAAMAPLLFGGGRIPAWGAAEAEAALRAIATR